MGEIYVNHTHTQINERFLGRVGEALEAKKIASNNPDSSLVDTIGRCKYHHLTSILLMAHTVVVTEACCAARQFTVGHRFK